MLLWPNHLLPQPETPHRTLAPLPLVATELAVVAMMTEAAAAGTVTTETTAATGATAEGAIGITETAIETRVAAVAHPPHDGAAVLLLGVLVLTALLFFPRLTPSV